MLQSSGRFSSERVLYADRAAERQREVAEERIFMQMQIQMLSHIAERVPMKDFVRSIKLGRTPDYVVNTKIEPAPQTIVCRRVSVSTAHVQQQHVSIYDERSDFFACEVDSIIPERRVHCTTTYKGMFAKKSTKLHSCLQSRAVCEVDMAYARAAVCESKRCFFCPRLI